MEERETACMPAAAPSGFAAEVAGYRWARDRVGESGGTIHRLYGKAGSPDLFLKQGEGTVADDIVAAIAEAAGVSKATTARTLTALERMGHATRIHGTRKGGKRTPDTWHPVTVTIASEHADIDDEPSTAEKATEAPSGDSDAPQANDHDTGSDDTAETPDTAQAAPETELDAAAAAEARFWVVPSASASTGPRMVWTAAMIAPQRCETYSRCVSRQASPRRVPSASISRRGSRRGG